MFKRNKDDENSEKDVMRIGCLVKFTKEAIEAFTLMGDRMSDNSQDLPDDLRSVIKELTTRTDQASYEVIDITVRKLSFNDVMEPFVSIKSQEGLTVGLLASMFEVIQSPSEATNILDELNLKTQDDGKES